MNARADVPIRTTLIEMGHPQLAEKPLEDDVTAAAAPEIVAISEAETQNLSPQRPKTAQSAPVTPNMIKKSSQGGSPSDRLEESPDD